MVKWDLYDGNFRKTDIVIDSEDIIDDGYYHISTNTWIINSNKEVMLVRNALNYQLYYPGFWGPITENVLSGDDGNVTVYRSLIDVIGLTIDINKIKRLGIDKRDPYHYIYETYTIEEDIELTKLKLDEDRIINVKWVNCEEIENMLSNGEIALVFKERIEKYILPLLK